MNKTAIILAAGSGSRAGGSVPKQLQNLHGTPVFLHSVNRFISGCQDTQIILVVNPSYRDMFIKHLAGNDTCIHIVNGGKSRLESVAAGLRAISDNETGLVAVHDAARPLLSVDMIRRGWKCAAEHAAAVPAIQVTDSLRKRDGTLSHAVDRALYMAVQTPQIFRTDILKKGYKELESLAETELAALTDDASVVERMGIPVHTYEGEATNLKITGPADLAIAHTILSAL